MLPSIASASGPVRPIGIYSPDPRGSQLCLSTGSEGGSRRSKVETWGKSSDDALMMTFMGNLIPLEGQRGCMMHRVEPCAALHDAGVGGGRMRPRTVLVHRDCTLITNRRSPYLPLFAPCLPYSLLCWGRLRLSMRAQAGAR